MKLYTKHSELEPVEVILKLTGDLCNIQCEYCYENCSPNSKSSFMDADNIMKAINEVPSSSLSIGIHGGEPLLVGIDSLHEILETLHSHEHVVDIRIQTNAILLTENIIKLLSKFDVKIGLSIDGDELLNQYRVTKNGNDTSKKVIDKLRLLEQLEVDIGIISVVSKANVMFPRQLMSFLSQYSCINTVAFIPCFDINMGKLEKYAITPLEYQRFLFEIYKHWKDSEINFWIEPFVSVINAKLGVEPDLCTFSNTKCSHTLTMSPDDKLSGCDFFTKSNTKHITEVQTVMIESYKQQEKHIDKCLSCNVVNICNGGCIATRNEFKNTKYYEEYCTHRKMLIELVTV